MSDASAAAAGGNKQPLNFKSLIKNKLIIFGIAVIVGIIVNYLPISSLAGDAQATLAIIAFVVVLWVGEVMPAGVAAMLIPVLLLVFLGTEIMPAKTVFGGFTNSTFWLMLGAFMLGQGTSSTGLAKRIAYSIMRFGGTNYTRLCIYLWIAGILLGALVPSGTVRVAIFIPIMMGIVAAYNAPSNSKFAANVLLHVYWSSIAASTLWYTGTNMNPSAMGIAETITGYIPGYMTWFTWMLIPTIVLSVGCFIITQVVMKPEKEILESVTDANFITDELAKMGKMTAAEKKALALFLVAIILWLTEKLHGISTAWVAIGMGLLCFMPVIGVLDKKALGKCSWDTLLLLGVALSFTGILKAVGLDTWLVDTLVSPILTPFSAMGSFGFALGIAILVALIHFLMASASAETTMLAPLICKFTEGIGGNVTVYANIVARSAQNLFLFPYQTLPLVVLWGTGYMDMPKCLKGMGAIFVFNLLWIALLGPYLEFMTGLIM